MCAGQLLERNHEVSHGVAEENSPRRKPWEHRKRVISPGRGDRILVSRWTFFRRYAAPSLRLSNPRLKPWATLCRCSAAICRHFQKLICVQWQAAHVSMQDEARGESLGC